MKRAWIITVPVLALLGGCKRESPPSPAAAASAPRAPSAAETLDRMDTRIPVPLLPMMANHQKRSMRDHLTAVQEIVAALATDDFPEIERAAGRIGFSEQMGQMCTHMGAGASGFTEQALTFHRTADRVAAAARDRDRTRVLTELGATLQTCTSCHAAWKQQVVDEPTWQSLTSTQPPPARLALLTPRFQERRRARALRREELARCFFARCVRGAGLAAHASCVVARSRRRC